MIATCEKGVSVVICSYNGAGMITETLRCLGRQKVPDSLKWEVILVDNASTDGTVETAKSAWKKGNYRVPLKIVGQPVPGVTAARVKGVNTAAYEYILTCDDDNRLEEHYVDTAFRMMEDNPEIGILGGKGLPVFEAAPPPWFDHFKHHYACGDQYEHEGDITDEKAYVYGAGSIYRKPLWNALKEHGFDLMKAPGRNRGVMTGGEDNMLGFMYTIAGYKIWYSRKLTFSHFIKTEKLNYSYLEKMSCGNGMTSVILDPFIDFIKGKNRSSSRMRKIYQTVRNLISIYKNHLPGYPHNDEEFHRLTAIHYRGRLRKLLDLKFDYGRHYRQGIHICESVKDLKSKLNHRP